MELINATRMVAGYTMGMEPSGRELLVVVVKGTFRISVTPGAALQLHEEQVPLVMSDIYFGEPGLSAPRYEVDFAPRKHRCDVLLNASAHAPTGREVERVSVEVRIGPWSKSFSVLGDRVWEKGPGSVGAASPKPFSVMPISYDRAFGGVDKWHDDPAQHSAFMRNPIGRGYHKHLKGEWLDGTPLPNTEETGNPVTRPDGNYRAMSFGVFGRGWDPRYRHAGTYDQGWLDNHFPFLPPDFSEQYYQAAPEDQQLQIPIGEQTVSLTHLTPDGRRTFVIPHFEAPIYIFPKKGEREDLNACADTLCIEPDEERVTMTWRVARPLKKNMFEIAQVLVGKKGKEWWQQREEVAFPLPVVMVPVKPEEDVEPA